MYEMAAIMAVDDRYCHILYCTDRCMADQLYGTVHCWKKGAVNSVSNLLIGMNKKEVSGLYMKENLLLGVCSICDRTGPWNVASAGIARCPL